MGANGVKSRMYVGRSRAPYEVMGLGDMLNECLGFPTCEPSPPDSGIDSAGEDDCVRECNASNLTVDQ